MSEGGPFFLLEQPALEKKPNTAATKSNAVRRFAIAILKLFDKAEIGFFSVVPTG